MTSETLRKLLVAGAAMAALSMSLDACAAPAIGNKAVVASTLDDRSLAVALAAYDTALNTYTAGVRAGVVTPAVIAKVRPLRERAAQVRAAAYAAYKVGNAADLGAQIKAIKDVTSQLKGAIGAL